MFGIDIHPQPGHQHAVLSFYRRSLEWTLTHYEESSLYATMLKYLQDRLHPGEKITCEVDGSSFSPQVHTNLILYYAPVYWFRALAYQDGEVVIQRT